jgi:hypothetical protein
MNPIRRPELVSGSIWGISHIPQKWMLKRVQHDGVEGIKDD